MKSTECFSRWRVTHDLVEDASAYFDLSTLEGRSKVTLPAASATSNCCFAALSAMWRSQRTLGQGRKHQQPQRAELAEAKLSEEDKACYWLRFEPFILHVCCRDLVAAAALMAAARTVFKNVGLQGWGDQSKDAKLIVAIWGDEGLDMPLTGPSGLPLFQGQDQWLQSLVNSRHHRNWGKIDRFTAALRQMEEPRSASKESVSEPWVPSQGMFRSLFPEATPAHFCRLSESQ